MKPTSNTDRNLGGPHAVQETYRHRDNRVRTFIITNSVGRNHPERLVHEPGRLQRTRRSRDDCRVRSSKSRYESGAGIRAL